MRELSEISDDLRNQIIEGYITGKLGLKTIEGDYFVSAQSVEDYFNSKIAQSKLEYYGEPEVEAPSLKEKMSGWIGRIVNSYLFDHFVKLLVCLGSALLFVNIGQFLSGKLDVLEAISIVGTFETLSKLFWGVWGIETFLFITNDVTIKYLWAKYKTDKDYTQEVSNGSITPYQRSLLHLVKWLGYLFAYCILNSSSLKGLATSLS